MNWLQYLADTKVFGIALNPWKIIGLSGSIIFGLRFLIQWIASERARKSVIPFGFLGMQRARVAPFAGLFRDLPARFRRRLAEHLAASNLPAEPLFSLYPSCPETRGRRAPLRGVIFAT